MTNNHDDLENLLRFDPLLEAEKFTGSSYEKDEDTMSLGFMLHMLASAQKEEQLTARGDTYFNSTLNEQLEVMESLGFETVLLDFFMGREYNASPPQETFRIMWHPKGVLATVESYQTFERNGTKFYYNVRFPETVMDTYFSYTSSGRFHTYDKDAGEYVWVGDHDGREAFKHHFTRLNEAGEFLPQWVKRPFLWLLTYMDTEDPGYDYEAINEERISRLPEHVRNAITP